MGIEMKKLLGIAVLVALVIATVLVAPNPFKITDPADPRFDPTRFDFCDYDELELWKALGSLFPPGTSKSYIDAVLVEAGDARTGPYNQAKDDSPSSLGYTTYGRPNKWCHPHIKKPPHYIFVFNSNDELVNIQTQHGASMFGDQLTLRWRNENGAPK